MTYDYMKKIITTTVAACACSLAMADANNAVHLGKSASKQQIIELLSPGQSKPLLTRGIQTRSLSLHGDRAVSENSKPKARAISLEVFFEFDSANLTESAKTQLTPVGEALTSEQLSAVSFVLEGHTDAAGSEQYNQSLSERRAASVKSFFLNEFNLAGERVSTLGKGESDLLEPQRPLSGANRRVTIIAQ